jgi:hypothetical protein
MIASKINLTIRKALFLAGLFCFGLILYANDGAFYASGNHLIPTYETQISVQKEVLSIKKVGDELDIQVHYTFFNPGKPKTITVGFEAASPAGDVDGTPINGAHPYMSDFSGELNSFPLRFKTAIVKDTNDYLNTTIHSMKPQEAMGDYYDGNYSDFYYVYYFEAPFKNGVNELKHHYRYKLSSSIMESYSFQYILTAANRWANNGIDDFTLELDLGEWCSFDLAKTFYEDFKNWQLDGIMKVLTDEDNWLPLYQKGARVYIKSGKLIYHQKDFQPKGELYIGKPNNYPFKQVSSFNADQHALPFDYRDVAHLTSSDNEISYKILRNLPYARRGYDFKTTFIQDYYQSQPWYQPNPIYEAKRTDLLPEELEWLKQVNESKY